MSTYVDKPLTLIERKKLQWAKEREELAELGAPWGSNSPAHLERPFQRNRYVVSKPTMANNNNNNEIFRNKEHSAISRRSSLPPLYKNQYNSIDKGGETSGYGSDNPNHPDNFHIWNNQSGYESSSSYKDDRAKWKDKNANNKFWEASDPPNWVKRGLQEDKEIIVSNTSPAESPQQDDLEAERPYTSSSSLNRNTYIRGQNIPIDSRELAERERRRQIALLHQEAIRQQLEEREKRRKEEREMRLKEEQEEEQRIEREQEIERQRKEREMRKVREKQEAEAKRKAAIQEALELAEKEAKLEKMKLKVMKQSYEDKEKREAEIENGPNIIHNNLDSENCGDITEKKSNLDQQHTLSSKVADVLNNATNNNTEPKGQILNTPRRNESSAKEATVGDFNGNKNTNNSYQILATPRADMALVVQTPLETLQTLQYAILMPTNSSATSAIPIAIPLTVTSDRPNTTDNRVLTPTQYRNRNRRFCDSSTQTDNIIDNNRYTESRSNTARDKFVEMAYENGKQRMSRNRSEERVVVVEERPKWGANRPPTRYLKQSEKDPLYQRRKLRQKMRDKCDYKNSSDESQTGSPRTYWRKNYVEKRHTRAMWRKNDHHFFARNVRMYQTEIVPLESDKEQIYYMQKCQCCCSCKGDSKIDIVKCERSSPHLPDCHENSSYIVDKLTSLHTGLLLKQEQWEKSPRTPSLSSSTRNTENN